MLNELTPRLQALDNWFTYHPPSKDQAERYVKIRDAAKIFATVIVECTPCSAESCMAMEKLRESMMLANAAIACNEPLVLAAPPPQPINKSFSVGQEVSVFEDGSKHNHRIGKVIEHLRIDNGKGDFDSVYSVQFPEGDKESFAPAALWVPVYGYDCPSGAGGEPRKASEVP